MSSVVVRGLLTGTMAGPRAWFFKHEGRFAPLRAFGLGAGGAMHRFPVSAFLVEHPSRGALLLDTGFARGACASPARHLGWVGTRVFKDARPSARGPAAGQLEALGIEVGLVVMTHLHWDHASALREFASARILVTRKEWTAARRPLANLSGYQRRHLQGCRDLEFVDFDGDGAEPWEAFSRTIDLFADGSVRLVSTPGHSPGHLSVVLRLRDRFALLAGDALYTLRTLRERHHPWQLGDARAYRQSFAAIEAFSRAHPDALIVPGHDLEAWERSGIERGL